MMMMMMMIMMMGCALFERVNLPMYCHGIMALNAGRCLPFFSFCYLSECVGVRGLSTEDSLALE